jgi:hypothetical protein
MTIRTALLKAYARGMLGYSAYVDDLVAAVKPKKKKKKK